MNKTELTKNFGICFKNLHTGEIEISIPDWDVLRRSRNRLRIGRLNKDKFYVASPGRAGVFRLSYQYELNLPLVGSGPATIKSHVLNSGCALRQYRATEKYLELVIAAIDVARKMLI